jgi:hypothetical protein
LIIILAPEVLTYTLARNRHAAASLAEMVQETADDAGEMVQSPEVVCC